MRQTFCWAKKVTRLSASHKTRFPRTRSGVAPLTLHRSPPRCLGLLSFLSGTREFNESSHTKAQRRMVNLPVWFQLVSPVCSRAEKSFQPETAPYSRGVTFQRPCTQSGCSSSEEKSPSHLSPSSGPPWQCWKDGPALDRLGFGQNDLHLKGKYCQSS